MNPGPTEQIEPAQGGERLADSGLLSEAAVEAVRQLGAGRIWGHCAGHGSCSPLMLFFVAGGGRSALRVFVDVRVITVDTVSVLVYNKFIAVHDRSAVAIAAAAVVVPSGEPGLGNGGEKEVALPTDGIRHRAEDGLVRAQRIRFWLKG